MNDGLVRRLQDARGQKHVMVAKDSFYWSSCELHANPLSQALVGLPGMAMPCQSGVGWKEEMLVKIGWPVWVAGVDYNRAISMPETPNSVLEHLVKIYDGSTKVSLIAAHPLASRHCLELLRAKMVGADHVVEMIDRRLAGGLEPQVARLEEAQGAEFIFSAAETDLSQVDEDVLRGWIEINDDEACVALADNPTLPLWAMPLMVKDSVYHAGLLDNPNTPTNILDEIVKHNRNSWELELVVAHANVSAETLARLSQHNRAGLAQLAAVKLARLMSQSGFTGASLEAAVEVEALSL